MKSARWILPLVWSLLAITGITVLLIRNPTAREVVGDSLETFFAVITTPFVFETTCAFLFLFALLGYNRWRLHKEGDGWVYLMTQEPEGEENSSAAPRSHSVVLAEKPEPVNDEENETSVIEGYLELGMAAQALEELDKAEAGVAPRSLDRALLRVRVLAANLNTPAALDLLNTTATQHPQDRLRLARAADLTAQWLGEHLPAHPTEAALWQSEAGKMRPA